MKIRRMIGTSILVLISGTLSYSEATALENPEESTCLSFTEMDEFLAINCSGTLDNNNAMLNRNAFAPLAHAGKYTWKMTYTEKDCRLNVDLHGVAPNGFTYQSVGSCHFNVQKYKNCHPKSNPYELGICELESILDETGTNN